MRWRNENQTTGSVVKFPLLNASPVSTASPPGDPTPQPYRINHILYGRKGIGTGLVAVRPKQSNIWSDEFKNLVGRLGGVPAIPFSNVSCPMGWGILGVSSAKESGGNRRAERASKRFGVTFLL